MRRKYRTGTTWCVWRWSDTDSEYLTRLHLVKTPWFAICLHWLHKPDPEPFLHDHPVTFLSLVLWGGYKELRQRWKRGVFRTDINTARRWNFVRAHDFDRHSIIDVRPRTLTLCFMGPKTREWGFWTKDGWVWWKFYYALQRAERGKAEFFRLKQEHYLAAQNRGAEGEE